MRNENTFGPLIVGFLLGGIVGGGVALLTAPQSGEETREQIHNKSTQLKDQTEQTLDEALRTMKKASEEIGEQVALLQAQQKESLEQSGKQWAQAVDEMRRITKEAAAEMRSPAVSPTE